MMGRIIVLLITITITAAAEVTPYLAKYLHDKDGAFSITCDDGFRHQVENTLKVLDPLGMKATFFIMPHAIEEDTIKRYVSWEQIRGMQKNGHEIGTHGRMKYRLHKVNDDTLDWAVNGGHRLITERTGVPPVSFAAPGGSKCAERELGKIREKHLFIRKKGVLPDITFGKYGTVPGRKEWNDERERKRLQTTMAEGKWQIATLHAIIKGFSPFKSIDEFRVHCTWIKAQENRLWIAPLGTVGRYVFTRQAAKLHILKQKPGSLIFRVTADSEWREHEPVSLTVVIPVATAEAKAYIDDTTELPVLLAPDKIMVDVPPDGRRVRIIW